jgi:myo-inositol-1(or 4)-monophosphatase
MFRPDFGIQFISELRAFCSSLSLETDLSVSTKSDNTVLTKIDSALSDFCKHHPSTKGFHFYSEEEHDELVFPALVVDPIDGTLELIEGRPECAVSIAWMPSPKLSEGFAVLFNPFSGFSLTTDQTPSWKPRRSKDSPLGMVSRTEWAKGGSIAAEPLLVPRGSIAFKLGLLASGACDYVVSRRPKNIWDIAAGTMLCHQRGMEFWSAGKRVESLGIAQYEAPLIWARPEFIPFLLSKF